MTGTIQAGGRLLASPQVLAGACQETDADTVEEYLSRLITTSGRRIKAYNQDGSEISGYVTEEDTYFLDCDQLHEYFSRGGDSSSESAFDVSQAVLSLMG